MRRVVVYQKFDEISCTMFIEFFGMTYDTIKKK